MGYFKPAEFRCRCGRADCDAKPMRAAFLAKLEALREDWGKALSPTSARRCKDHNDRVGGAADSQHLDGKACDFNFTTKKEAASFAELAEKHGFGGIGLGERLVHIDDRGYKARWTYSDR